MHIWFRVHVPKKVRNRIDLARNTVEIATVVAILVFVVRAL